MNATCFSSRGRKTTVAITRVFIYLAPAYELQCMLLCGYKYISYRRGCICGLFSFRDRGCFVCCTSACTGLYRSLPVGRGVVQTSPNMGDSFCAVESRGYACGSRCCGACGYAGSYGGVRQGIAVGLWYQLNWFLISKGNLFGSVGITVAGFWCSC